MKKAFTLRFGGFTLVEIIIVMGIIMIFLGSGVSVYQKTSQRQGFTEDVELFVSIIEKNKQRTLARDLAPVAGCNSFGGYNVLIDLTNNTYQDEMECDGTRSLNLYKFKNTKIISPTSSLRLSFTYPYAKLNPPGDQTVILKNANVGSCINVIIKELGLVSKSAPYSC